MKNQNRNHKIATVQTKAGMECSAMTEKNVGLLTPPGDESPLFLREPPTVSAFLTLLMKFPDAS